MKSTPSVLASVLACKCPKCRKGNMFPKGNLMNPLKFHKMNERCAVCEQSFEPEPGFYFGAMFVSYGLNFFLFVAIWTVLAQLVEDYTLTTLLVLLGLASIVMLPFTFRLSRSIWIAIFVPFQKIRS